LKEDEKEANEHFYDFTTSKALITSGLIEEIKAVHYPSYSVRRVNEADFPFSKRTRGLTNNPG
jgi:hypothetical protein